jgi:PAS domain S-box-containing protein
MLSPPATILFIAEDRATAPDLPRWLREEGFRVVEATNVANALAILRPRPKLVLIDSEQQEAITPQDCMELRARFGPLTPLLLLNWTDEREDIWPDELLDGILAKPVQRWELLTLIRTLLRSRSITHNAIALNDHWQAIFDTLEDGVCQLDEERKIVRANKAFSLLVGLSPTELVGKTLPQALCYSAVKTNILELAHALASLQGPQRATQEFSFGERHLRICVDQLLDPEGKILGSVWVLCDLTQRLQLEEQLRQHQRLESIGRLAGGVAHDFNNLLTAILGNTSLLLRSLRPEQGEYQLATTIERAAWRGADLVRQLLGFSRQMLLWLQPIRPSELLCAAADQLRGMAEFDKITVECRQEEDLWSIQGDPTALGQGLIALCRNSLDAMPDGGVLRLIGENVVVTPEDGRQRAEAIAGQYVRLSIEDNGMGIEANHLDKIFDPFFTTKPTGRGSGLGLAMMYGLVKQLQGWIECVSEPATGTRFDIYLPRSKSDLGQDPVPARVASPEGRRKILIVDENETLRNLAAAYLRQGGFDVTLATSLTELRNLASAESSNSDSNVSAPASATEANPQSDLEPDLVILQQPFSRDCQEHLRQLQGRFPNLRVLLAGGSMHGHLRGELQMVAGMVARPYRERDLLEGVKQALAQALPC